MADTVAQDHSKFSKTPGQSQWSKNHHVSVNSILVFLFKAIICLLWWGQPSCGNFRSILAIPKWNGEQTLESETWKTFQNRGEK